MALHEPQGRKLIFNYIFFVYNFLCVYSKHYRKFLAFSTEKGKMNNGHINRLHFIYNYAEKPTRVLNCILHAHNQHTVRLFYSIKAIVVHTYVTYIHQEYNSQNIIMIIYSFFFNFRVSFLEKVFFFIAHQFWAISVFGCDKNL